MSNQLMIFEGQKVEVFNLNGIAYFNPYHVGACLELTDSAVRKAITNMNASQVVKLKNPDVKDIHIRKLNNAGENFLTESGVYKLVFRSNKPKAERFTDWVTDEVLPSIRQTGAYISDNADLELIKRKAVEAKLRNAKSRQASLLLKIADKVEIPEYKQVLYSHATEVVSGQKLLPLPAVEKITYSAGEIASMLGIPGFTANKVGRIANLNGLKTPEYGKLFYDKSPHANKQVETWRYYDTVIPVLREIAEKAGVIA